MYSEIVTMIRKYYNHKLQTTPWLRKEKQHNNHRHQKDKLNNAISSLLRIKMIQGAHI